MTLVTQCSADRLHAILFQALRWGGDISLAVYVPSAPSSVATKVRSSPPETRRQHFLPTTCRSGSRPHSSTLHKDGDLYLLSFIESFLLTHGESMYFTRINPQDSC